MGEIKNSTPIFTRDKMTSTLKNTKLLIVFSYHSAGKHDRGPLFFALVSFRLIRSRLAGSI